jgi:hypothetical protein
MCRDRYTLVAEDDVSVGILYIARPSNSAMPRLAAKFWGRVPADAFRQRY